METLTYLQTQRGFKDFKKLRDLYERSFPDDERIPFDMLFYRKRENYECDAVYLNEEMIGMYYLFLDENLVYLSYICIKDVFQGRGYGTLILRHIHDSFQGKRIVVDIEEVKKEDEGYAKELRRRAFYLKCGYLPTGIFYHIYHVDYELLSYGGKVSRQEWHQLILKHWGKRADTALYRQTE